MSSVATPPAPGRVRAWPLSSVQERMWFLARLDPASTAYNLPLSFRLHGPLDTAALDRALAEVVRRHAILRTVFRMAGEKPVQVASPASTFQPGHADFSALDPAAREAALAARVAADLHTPFDLERGPLFRAETVRMAADDHVLRLTVHHAVTDAWSQELLLRELAALYGAFRRGLPSPLAEPAMQYGEYAAWQRKQLQGEAMEAQLEWWRGQLRGAPTLLELPADHPRAQARDGAGAQHAFRIPARTWTRLEALGRAEGCTPFMVLLAGWQAVVARHSGQTDFLIGTPVANRPRRELQDIPGCFLNTLALRADVSGAPGFRELLRRVRAGVLGAFAHAALPFERLVDEMAPGRSQSHAPLVQTFFVVTHAEPGAGRFDDLRMEPYQSGVNDTTVTDLTLSLRVSGDGVNGVMQYATGLFSAARMERMADHLARLLEGAAAHPDRPVHDLPLLSAAEAERQAAWGRGPRAEEGAEPIHRLFEASARATPNATALVHGTETVTYAELEARANRIAHRLAALGVGPETRVGVCLRRTPELVAALLGVLKAGGAYVALDPAYPRERTAAMLLDSRASLVLTQAEVAPLLPESDAARVILDDAGEAERIAASPSSAPRTAVDVGSLAYVIYTSGSTGRPKGVGITHAASHVLLRWFVAEIGAEELSVVLASTSVCFDVSIAEIFGGLAAGGRLVLARNALAWPELPAGGDVTYASMIPSAAAELGRIGAIPASVRTLGLGGEPLKRTVADGLYAATNVRRVLNFYGPTEDTTYSTWWMAEREGGGAMPVGRTVAGTRAYVLDARLNPVPEGAIGELWLAGRGLARGYIGRPAMTADAWLPCPYGTGERMYRTGDRARWRPDGVLEVLGRLDFQVKIRGYRVELEEVESAFLRQPGVTAVVAVVREDAPGDPRLIVYAAGPALAGEDAERLRAGVRDSLPDFMVPATVVVLDALPLNPNGKVDRARLPAPAALAAPVPAAAPRTPAEEVMAGIWAELLGVDAGLDTDFFEAGGHSLLAVQLLARVRAAFGVELPLRDVFEHGTLAALAARVSAGDGARRPPVTPVPRGEPLPLSFTQERFWFLQRMDPASAAYNLAGSVVLRGALDADALSAAWREVVRRHEVLRSTLAMVGGAARQFPGDGSAFTVGVIDLTGLAEDERRAEARRLAVEEAAAPFLLEREAPLRVRLLRTGAEEHVLLFTLHHAACDGWSLAVITRELGELYAAFREGRPSPLAEPVLHFADFAAWEREWVGEDARAAALAWWTRRLAGLPPLLDLPADRARPAVQGSAGARHPFTVPADVAERLRTLARGEGATLYMALMAALQTVLGRWSGQDDLVVGMPVSGRGPRELDNVVGCFLNTLVLRGELAGDPSFRALLGRVRAATLDAFAHPDVPLELLARELGRDRGAAPLVQVSLVLQNQASATLALPGIAVQPLLGETPVAKHDLSFSLRETAEGIVGGLQYSTELFDPATAARFATQFVDVLRSAADTPDAPLSALGRAPVPAGFGFGFGDEEEL